MKSDQINELAAALAKAQIEIKSAVKDANNPFYKSKYADLTSVWEACKDALNDNGLSIVQTIQSQNVLETMLIHTSGQWISGECPLINLKGDMQGLGSAISYARRYSIAAICGVVTEDDDAESAGKSSDKHFPKGNSFLTKTSGTKLTTNPSEINFKALTEKDRCTKAQAKMLIAKLAAKGYIGSALKQKLLEWKLISTDEVAFVKVDEMIDLIEALPKKSEKPFDPSEPPPVEDFDIPWSGAQ